MAITSVASFSSSGDEFSVVYMVVRLFFIFFFPFFWTEECKNAENE